jgi:hypothetical protein
MNCIHLVCKGGQNLSRVEKGKDEYTSGSWALSQADADRLIGGMLYFHETKARRSYFGGKVLSARVVENREKERRMVFTFKYLPEGRDVAWRGEGRATAWTSGVKEVP